MSVTARHLVGREEELGAIVGLLDDPEHLFGVAVLTGEAGVGKTTLWLAGIEAAAERGYRVLSCRPSEAETRYSFAALADLLGRDIDDVAPELPAVQRRALEAVLLLEESDEDVDERAIAAAFLEAVRLRTSNGPLCLAVDDIHWLDAASLTALRSALARLNDAPVIALLAARGELPDWARRAVPEEHLREIEVTGLSVGALHRLLSTRLETTFPRPTLIRIWETSGGNPFFALELADALKRRDGTLAPGEELPITRTLDGLLRERLDGLGSAALELARVVGALADPTASLAESAVGRRFDAGLAELLAARILELDGDRLRFTHPLLRSAVAARQTPARRRSLHARLAKIAPTDEERAQHLALATEAPNQEVASMLERSARAAQSRGASAAAAELADKALLLTPEPRLDDARRRVFLAADLHQRAGNTERAIALLEQTLAATGPGSERAAVLMRLAGIRGNAERALALYEAALLEADGDDALEAAIHIGLVDTAWSEGFEHGLHHGSLAVGAASRAGDPSLRGRAIGAYGLMHFRAGRGIPIVEMEEALALERALPEWPREEGLTTNFALQLVWAADVERARTLLDEILTTLEDRDDPGSEAAALWGVGLLEWRAGNWDEADRHATAAMELKTQLGRLTLPDEFPAIVIAAHQGRIDEARARAQVALARSEAEGIRIAESGYSWVLGFVEVSLGEPASALPFLRRSYEVRNDFMLEPAQRLELGDLLEALIAVGELDEAEAVLATWQTRAEAVDRAWALAILARCRGLLFAARGDFDSAFATFERSLAEHGRGTDPFHQARTLLALGRTQRRAKRRGDARRTLEDSLARFETLGAPLWADQSRAELARIGGRAPSHGELTEGERRVAALVAQGRTNREVAAALFLGERTVETHLTRVYRKLGVRSRAELAHLLTPKN